MRIYKKVPKKQQQTVYQKTIINKIIKKMI